MTPPTMPFRRIGPILLLGIALAAVFAWLWICWCLFPSRGWNDVRLAPVFGLKLGLPLYPGIDGPAGTWMYGPLPVLLLWPATWACDAFQALLVADTVNLFITVGAVIAVCAWWPVRGGSPPRAEARLAAALLTLAIWPGATWQYLQADNSAIALGLLANLVLVRVASPAGGWLAAFLAMAGLFCKQTSLAVPLAQVIWLILTQGRTAARDQGLRLLAAGAAWGVVFLLLAPDARAMWFNMVSIPANLPWADQPWTRLWDLSHFIAVHLAVPLLVWIWLRRDPLRCDLVLPMLVWLIAWLPGLASVLKIGGTLNTLQGFPLWLPAGMVVTLAAGERWLDRRRTTRIATAAIVILCAWRIILLSTPPLRPLPGLYREAAHLAENLPEQIWFPWHPLVTVFSEKRLYHVEDGLYVRFLSGRPLTLPGARRNLPPHMNVIALPRGGSDWGIAISLHPPDAQVDDFGSWTLHSWPPAPPDAR